MVLVSSCRSYPRPILADMYASGYPVALLASAEERDSRGFISMATYFSDAVSSANWTLHSPTIPTCEAARRLAERSMWYSRLLMVWEGATTMLSPVCTFMARMFSMLHTMTPLPAVSRITSYSICFHPPMYSSMSTWPTRLAFMPRSTISWSSSSLRATPPPLPPSVYATRTITG